MPSNSPGDGVIAGADLDGDGRMDLLAYGLYGEPASYFGNGDGTFTPGASLTEHSASLTTGDFDGDGVPDIVSVTERVIDGVSSVGLTISRGGALDVGIDGPRVPAPQLPTGVWLNPVVGDFDGDHHLDVALGGVVFSNTTNEYDSSISVFRGNSDLTFQSQQVLASDTSTSPSSWLGVGAADVNGDGRTDVAGFRAGQVTVWLGQSDGGFSAPIVSTIAAGTDVKTKLVDVNNDGKIDLVAEGGAVALGNGDGTFQTPIAGAVGDDLALADLDGDGKLDRAMRVHDTSVVTIARGNGDGTFETEVGYDFSASGKLLLLDVDGDARPDLLYGIGMRHNRGNGTFTGWRGYIVASDPIGALLTIASGDLDGDGNTDLAVTAEGKVRILLGAGDTDLRVASDLVPASGAESVAIADIDGDGSEDIASVSGSSITAWLNDGSGHFGAPVSSSASGFYWAVGDLDLDGRADVVNADADHIEVFRGAGDGSFVPLHQYSRPDCMMNNVMVLAIADVDRDGKPDLVTSDCMATSVRRGQGNGALGSATTIAAPSYHLAFGDLDNDGRLDIALDSGVLFAKASGGWSAPVSVPGALLRPSIADFDGDGRVDLSTGDGTVWTYDSGAFRSVVHVALPGTIPVAILIDLNGDGKAELVSSAGGVLDVLANDCRP